MAEYTDMLGNPIKVGDTIAYPLQLRSTSAQMSVAVVTDIEPVVPVYAGAVVGWWKRDFEFEPEYRIPKKMVTMMVDGKRVYDPSKAYIVKGIKKPDNRMMYLQNVDRCIVITPLLGEKCATSQKS
jgi:hypothetical protein